MKQYTYCMYIVVTHVRILIGASVRAAFHRKDTPSTSADSSPTQTQTGEGATESDYATIRQNHSVNNRLTAQREEVKYDLPHRGSHSSTMSQDSSENIQPFPVSSDRGLYDLWNNNNSLLIFNGTAYNIANLLIQLQQ